MITPYRGRWDVQKRPIAWTFDISLTCAMCGVTASFTGKAEEGTTPNVRDWRRVASPSRGHSDPLAEDAVVCSRGCANEFVCVSLDKLFE